MFKDFKGQQLDGNIITNSGADRISEVGRVTVLSTHNKLQVIVFSKPLYLIWFEISMKKYLSHYFVSWTDSKYHKTTLHNASKRDFTK